MPKTFAELTAEAAKTLKPLNLPTQLETFLKELATAGKALEDRVKAVESASAKTKAM